jgi:branched-chain amino acid transport system ATP-binding protein
MNLKNELLLSVQDLYVDYTGVLALQGVSLEVSESQPTAIIGPNGAGKTTLLKSISGILKPSSGTILFKGQNIIGLPPDEIVRIGISHVPEGRRIFPYMTVYENLRMGAFIEKQRAKENGNFEKVFTLFPELKMRKKQLGGTLSGGEQQMLAIGRALMRDISLLLLDEPTIGLSPIMVQLLSERIKELTVTGVSMLLVEQNVKMALNLSEVCYLMSIGKIELGGRSDLLEQDERVQRTYLGSS